MRNLPEEILTIILNMAANAAEASWDEAHRRKAGNKSKADFKLGRLPGAGRSALQLWVNMPTVCHGRVAVLAPSPDLPGPGPDSQLLRCIQPNQGHSACVDGAD